MLGEGIGTELSSRVRQGGQDALAAHALSAVWTEGGFHAQGFHCGHWPQVSFSRCLPSKSHTSNGWFMQLRVYFSIFFLHSGVVLCGGNCLLRCTEKETARQR